MKAAAGVVLTSSLPEGEPRVSPDALAHSHLQCPPGSRPVWGSTCACGKWRRFSLPARSTLPSSAPTASQRPWAHSTEASP